MTKSKTSFFIFLIRNLLLYFLFFHAYLYFRRDLDLIFLSVGFILAVALALWTDLARLRLWLAAVIFIALVVGLRFVFFLVFRLQSALSPGPHTDFLFFSFDKNFFPSLVPWAVVWLFNVLYLRAEVFVYLEVGLNAFLLLAVYWTQASYRITLYSHPSLLAYGLFFFLLLEIVLLVLAGTRGAVPRRVVRLRSVLSFVWILVPLLLILLVFVLGRYNQGAVRLGGGLMKPTLFRFDFSQYIKLESEIEMSDDLVLLFRKQGPAERILLRRYILSGYEPRRGFFHVPELPVTVADSSETFEDPAYQSRHEVVQEYFFVNFDPTSLIGMNYPLRVVPLTNWDSSSFLRIYRVISRVSAASADELAAASGRELPSESFELYTDYGEDERIRTLAEQITGGAADKQADTLSKVMKIHDYLKSNYYYSLTPGLAEDGDQLSHFLYSSKKGYCSYFAFSMALLCRSLGIPARVAVGFYVNPDTAVLNFYEVRAYQAHAWVEVYFGPYGWIEFDPSSETIAPGEEYTIQFGFDLETLARLLEEILKNQHSLREQSVESIEVEDRVRLFGGELVRGLRIIAGLWYVVLPLLYLLVLGSVKAAPLLRARLTSCPRKKIKFLFTATRVRLQSLGLSQSGEESVLEYAQRLEAERPLSLVLWSESYLMAVFSDTFGQEELEAAMRGYLLFVASWRRCFSLPRRVLGFLNPLSAARGKP